MLLSVGLGLLTILVNLRDLGVLGTGIGHAAFTGGVIGILLGAPWLWTILTGMLVALLSQRIEGKRVSSANSVIVAFTFILAFGSYFPTLFRAGFYGYGLLFGSMLGVDSFDIMLTSVATLLLVVFL